MSVAINGERISGEAVLNQNVMATQAVANIVKSSLGPIGLDKMLVDDVGDITVTNDGATILKLLEVEHPAAKIICDLANIQDKEVGDGTTSVVIIAAELLKNAQNLIQKGLHQSTIISGYRHACREACKYIKSHIAVSSSKIGKSCLINVAKTSISSKILSSEIEYFSKLAVEAAKCVTRTTSGKTTSNVESINILKAHGGKMKDSTFIHGFALNCVIANQCMPTRITNAKIACIDFSLQRTRMAMGIQVLVSDPDKLEAIRHEETDIVMRRIRMILSAGANVILTTGGIDDTCMKPFIESKCMAVRRVLKSDLKQVAEITGATVLLSLANSEGGESFEASFLGHASEVEQRRVSDNELIVISGSNFNGGSFILRGANDSLCDEMERSLTDCLFALKRVVESDSVVAGGGAVETALSVYLDQFACSISTKEQLSISSFANSLLVIPKTLAINAALDSSDIVAKLKASHFKAANNADTKQFWNGLNLITGVIQNNMDAGILEPSMLKEKMIKFATETAITILRIDDIIKLAPEQKEPRDGEDQCY